MTAAKGSWDLILVGGGLANSLIAYRLAILRPDVKILVVEAGTTFGGNHTWSFHETDITAAQLSWTAPFVSSRWPFYHVAFPGLHRRIEIAYRSVTSERLHAVMSEASIATRFSCSATELQSRFVRFEDGSVLHAAAVIDGRGFQPTPHLRLGYQKFLGLEVQLAAPHRLSGPLVMDATVEQADGYRFVYTLPFAADRLMIEDTYYADSPELDVALLRGKIEAYARDKGWTIDHVIRQETGVLPITLAGNIDGTWAQAPGQPRVGLRAGLFHPTTGYSWADAVRLADSIAALRSLDALAIHRMIEAVARRRWREQRFFRALNRMLFQAGPADTRWAMMRRFYRFPQATIERFYAGTLFAGDKVRLLIGKPPVPIAGAISALMDYGIHDDA